MNKQRRDLIGALAVGFFVSGVASASAGGGTPRERPDIDTIVRQFHVNFSNGDIEKNGALVEDNVVVELNGGADSKPNGATFKGRAEFIAWLEEDKRIFPDARITDHDVVVSGNMAAIRFTQVGTHQGAMPTPSGIIQPTGRKVVIQATEFFTFNDNGKLVLLHTLTNDLSALAQLMDK